MSDTGLFRHFSDLVIIFLLFDEVLETVHSASGVMCIRMFVSQVTLRPYFTRGNKVQSRNGGNDVGAH